MLSGSQNGKIRVGNAMFNETLMLIEKNSPILQVYWIAPLSYAQQGSANLTDFILEDYKIASHTKDGTLTIYSLLSEDDGTYAVTEDEAFDTEFYGFCQMKRLACMESVFENRGVGLRDTMIAPFRQFAVQWLFYDYLESGNDQAKKSLSNIKIQFDESIAKEYGSIMTFIPFLTCDPGGAEKYTLCLMCGYEGGQIALWGFNLDELPYDRKSRRKILEREASVDNYSFKLLHLLRISDQPISCIGVSHMSAPMQNTAKLFAVCAFDGVMKLLSLEENLRLNVMAKKKLFSAASSDPRYRSEVSINSVAFSFSDRFLVVSTSDAFVRLIDIDSMAVLHTDVLPRSIGIDSGCMIKGTSSFILNFPSSSRIQESENPNKADSKVLIRSGSEGNSLITTCDSINLLVERDQWRDVFVVDSCNGDISVIAFY